MNNTFYPANDYRSYLEHHGILGMKRGVRRYQNSDGSLTATGKARVKKENFASKAIGGIVKYNVNTGNYIRATKQADMDARAAKNEADWRNMKNAKTVREKLGVVLGTNKTAAERLRIDAEAERKKADAADKFDFQLKKYEHLSNAKNKEYEAQYRDKLSKMTRGQRIVERLIRKEWHSTPYTTITSSGEKTITRGQKAFREYVGKMVEDILSAKANRALGGDYFKTSSGGNWHAKESVLRKRYNM